MPNKTFLKITRYKDHPHSPEHLPFGFYILVIKIPRCLTFKYKLLNVKINHLTFPRPFTFPRSFIFPQVVHLPGLPMLAHECVLGWRSEYHFGFIFDPIRLFYPLLTYRTMGRVFYPPLLSAIDISRTMGRICGRIDARFKSHAIHSRCSYICLRHSFSE